MRSALSGKVCFLSVLLAGLLAGLQWGTGMAQYTALHLPADVWLLRHQAEDALFRQVMPVYMWLVLLSLAGAAILTRGRTRILFAVATFLSLLQMIVTVAHEVPINRLVAHWTPATLPEDWDAVRHRWMSGHWLRTGLSLVAFSLAALGLRSVGSQSEQPTVSTLKASPLLKR